MSVITTREEVPQIIRSGAAGPRRPLAPAAGGMSGQDFLRILRKRMWLIILVTLGSVVITGVVTLLWLQYAPYYTAEAFLVVNPPRPSDLVGTTPAYPKEIMDRFVMTQVRMIMGEPVLLRAISSPEFKRTTWANRIPPERHIPELIDSVEAAPVANTAFIRISMKSTDKNDLPEIVNAIARAAEKDSREATSSDMSKAIERLSDERKSTEADLSRVRNEIADLRSSNDVSTLQERRNVLALRLQTYTQDLIEMERGKQQAQSSLDDLDLLEKENLIEHTPEARMRLDEDPMLRSLRIALVNLDGDVEATKEKYGPKSLQVKNVLIRRDTLAKQLADAEDKIKMELRQTIREARRTRLNGINAELLDIQRKFNEVDFKARDIQNVQTTLTHLDKSESDLTDSIKKIDDALRDLHLQAKQEPPVFLRRPATIPREPSFPRWIIMMPAGLILGLLLALGLAFLLETMDTSIKGPSDVTRRTELPLLGMVPHTGDLDEDIPDVRLAFQSHPNSLVGEAFRQIRTCLLFSGPAERRKSLLITSPLPEDGRGTVAMNLAGAIARGGRRVLVVDTNFRQPMIRNLFPQCPEAGLSSALVGQASWRDLVREVEPNLTVMPSGPLPPNPAELLGSEQMRQILGEMVAAYDQVIFDSSPCLVVSDPTILSTIVDGVVMVVRAGVTTYGIVQRCKEVLNRVGAHVIGIVLNGVRAQAGGYLRKTYETFYEYHEQARLPGK